MSAHQPVGAAARRAADEAPEQQPSMHQLLAACAAASAVSTPPDAPVETRADKPAKDGRPASTEGRDAA